MLGLPVGVPLRLLLPSLEVGYFRPGLDCSVSTLVVLFSTLMVLPVTVLEFRVVLTLRFLRCLVPLPPSCQFFFSLLALVYQFHHRCFRWWTLPPVQCHFLSHFFFSSLSLWLKSLSLEPFFYMVLFCGLVCPSCGD